MANDFLKDTQLKAIMPMLSAEKRKIYLPWLNLSMAYFKINTELRVSMYLAQLAHESTDLTRWVENLNYSARRLTQVWPKRFPTLAAASPYAHNPQALANKTYNGRMGNRAGSNDGWTYRGRAPLQCTGRDLYAAATNGVGKDFDVDFVVDPDLLLQVKYGFLVSAWIFAVEKNCLPLADAKNIRACTQKINGGTNGLADRVQNYRNALAVLPDGFALKSYDAFSKELAAAEAVGGTVATNSRLDVENSELYTPAVDPEPAEGATAPPDPEKPAGEAETTKEVHVDGDSIHVSVDSTQPPEKIAVVKPEPQDFASKMRNQVAALTGGNVGLQAVRDWAEQAKFLGLSATFWFWLSIIAATGAVTYIVIAYLKHRADKREASETTKALVEANTTPSNTVQLISADAVADYKERGYKVITR